VGPIAVLDTEVKKKIPSPRQESKSRTSIVQPVAQLYTDLAITSLNPTAKSVLNAARKQKVFWQSGALKQKGCASLLHTNEIHTQTGRCILCYLCPPRNRSLQLHFLPLQI
jgi:hypothetical protein